MLHFGMDLLDFSQILTEAAEARLAMVLPIVLSLLE